MAARHSEARFEDAVVEALVSSGGWRQGDPAAYDRQTRLFPWELWAFLEATQPEKVERLGVLFGQAFRRDVERLIAKELDRRPAGVLYLLRHGLELRGVKLDFCYFRPAHGLTPELEQRYAANRLTVVRQLFYSPEHRGSVDVALFVNGLGVASAELKNALTGQTVADAKRQYRSDRDPGDLFLSRRCVVHFAVDTDQVAMTTKLAGSATKFLPFNRGSRADGSGGEGNPPAEPGGYATSYLWEQVWQRDAWLDILGRFIHFEEAGDDTAAPSVIFPRYHQWDAVLRLLDDAKRRGAGQHYLVAHSAGSGKTNTIGWLAHRLASLHGSDDDRPVFDKVIVVTDRQVLDRQLQAKIEQFERRSARGMVASINRHSSQLAEALHSPGVKIVVTTLQKFPHILADVADLPERRYAVIIDEAHSSQSGETAKKMKQAIAAPDGGTRTALEAAAEAEAASSAATGEDEINTMVETSAAARGRQPNLSMFAFTATPKAKTLELFGTRVSHGNGHRSAIYQPFHLYSMRQAIEEGYILDVLEHYTPYRIYYQLSVAGEDLKVERSKAAAAAARYASLHPYALGQKAEIIVEHYRSHTARQIGGKAKAMVVTRSRLHAVRTKLAIDAYIKQSGYTGIAALVAFSGEVIDPDVGEDPYTEAGMNRFRESETASRFGTDDYQVMVVAEKFQTGFDQPLLHTMFIDKKLEGVNAVQTLSRLNRTHPGKDSTFVLDFVNDPDEIQEAFEPYYETTVATETEPERLYDVWRQVEDYLIIDDADVERFAAVWFAAGDAEGRRAHAEFYRTLAPCEDRFAALTEEDQDAFRKTLRQFVRLYAFLSQVLSYADTTMEKRYALARMLSQRLRDQRSGTLDLGDDVAMTHFRIEAGRTQDLTLDDGEGQLTAFTGDAAPRATQEELVLLSEVIDKLNERFGTDFTEDDTVKFEALAAEMSADPMLQEQAAANDLDHFTHAFDERFTSAVVEWVKGSEELAVRLLDDPAFAEIAKTALVRIVHRQAAQRHSTD